MHYLKLIVDITGYFKLFQDYPQVSTYLPQSQYGRSTTPWQPYDPREFETNDDLSYMPPYNSDYGNYNYNMGYSGNQDMTSYEEASGDESMVEYGGLWS